ncbi:transcriptional regulator, AraC family, putative [gamma proteobacterium HTCC5015]|nr:transcriptional regulator, AraC family, putative [gamma proteobacterium HTCC5015]
MAQLFTCTALIPGFISLAAQHGVSLDSLNEKLGIEPPDLNDPFAGISLEKLDDMLCLFRDESGNDSFFLELGAYIRFESLGVIGQLIATATSTRQALEQYNEFKDIIHPFAEFSIREEDGQTIIAYAGDEDWPISKSARYEEIFMTSLVTIGRFMHGDKYQITEASFRHAEPDYIEQYERIFQAPVLFNQSECHIRVPSEVMNSSLSGASPQFNQSFAEKAQVLLSRLPSDSSLAAEVVQAIESKIGYAVFSMQDIAGELNMTQRTLQRRLKEEGTSYAQLRDSVRFRFAEEYLRDSSMDMATIAANLGFSEPANFYAAFKRWQGMSPGEYRKRFIP